MVEVQSAPSYPPGGYPSRRDGHLTENPGPASNPTEGRVLGATGGDIIRVTEGSQLSGVAPTLETGWTWN